MAGADPIFARRLVFWGATVLPLGIATAAVFSPGMGCVLTLCALVILVAGVHLLGRAGPDPGV